jgi:hypothetical protein
MAAVGGQIEVRAPLEQPYREEPVDLHRTREILAYLLLALFAATLVASLFFVGSADSWARAKEFLQIALPAEIGLLGGAIGFYFATASAEAARDA